MAATWLKSLHVNKGKTIARTLKDRTDYAENPDKTRKGELVTSYECSSQLADREFLLSKKQYFNITGRSRGKDDVLAYHIRQAFKPGEITPEQANELGRALALRFTKGNHAFIVATHEDKSHIHNHIVFNSTSLDCTRKFRDFKKSAIAVRRLSDTLCLESGLSVIENPKSSKGHYGTWLGENKQPSWREKLEQAIDDVLAQKPVNFDAFLKLLLAQKIEVKTGKHIALKMPGQKRFSRLKSLSENYSEEAIRERIDGKRIVPPKQTKQPKVPAKFNLLIDIQNSIKAQNSPGLVVHSVNCSPKHPGYERWAKLFNLKQAAKTLLFLQDNGITEIGKLQEKAQKAKDDFNDISDNIKAKDKRLQEVSELQKHIGSYSKTREVYAEFRKGGFSKKFQSKHSAEIEKHKVSKKYFDELGLVKLPTIKTLQAEYATVNNHKKKLYAEYNIAKNHMQEILMAKQNAEQLLNYKDDLHELKKGISER